MKKKALILIFLASTTVFPFSQKHEGKSLKSPKSYIQLIRITMSILEREKYSKVKGNISPEAYLINNNSYDNINEVLNNPEKREKFIEGKNARVEYSNILISEDKKDAYLVLETVPIYSTKTKWHTIYFEKGKNDKWLIMSWHKS